MEEYKRELMDAAEAKMRKSCTLVNNVIRCMDEYGFVLSYNYSTIYIGRASNKMLQMREMHGALRGTCFECDVVLLCYMFH